MPELPEVETIRRGLVRLIEHKPIAAVTYDNPKSFPNTKADVEQFLIGAQVEQIERRGKALLLNLDSDYSLIVHLKMTGQLVYDATNVHFGAGHPSDSLVHRLPDKTTHVTLRFADGSQLFFNDQRKFGWMRLHPTAQISDLPFFARLGPEPLERALNWQMLKGRLRRRLRSPIKAALLDQSVLAGVGNIYADESLWGAKIHPGTPVGLLTDRDYRNLQTALVTVLGIAIKQGGSTDRNYVDALGNRGSYLDFARVFRRQGQPCPRCGRLIIKTRVAGRGTHLCPHCQKLKAGAIIMKTNTT